MEILPVVVHTEILDGWGMYYISVHFSKKTKTYKTDNIRILYYIIMCYYALRSCTRHEWIREKYNNINRRHLPQMKIIEHLHKGTPRTCCILYKSNNVLDLRPGLELGAKLRNAKVRNRQSPATLNKALIKTYHLTFPLERFKLM